MFKYLVTDDKEGKKMKTFEQMVENLLNRCGDIVISHLWYILPVVLGTLFRYGLLKYRIYIPETKVKKICRDIGILVILTIMWNFISTNRADNKMALTVVILTMVYCFFIVAQKCPDGTTESLLLIVNSTMVTTLSFISFPYSLGFAVLTVVLALFAYNFCKDFEQKSDLWEIIIMCIESVIISIYVTINSIDNILQVTALVIFVETVLFMINCLLKYSIKFLCKEDIDDYWDKLLGLM